MVFFIELLVDFLRRNRALRGSLVTRSMLLSSDVDRNDLGRNLWVLRIWHIFSNRNGGLSRRLVVEVVVSV
jgi:hypothetical protein